MMKPAKLTRKDLVSFARDGQEKIIANYIPAVALEHIGRFPTREEQQFVFRCFWIPYELVGVYEKKFLSTKGRAGNVWQFATLTASSRILWEMQAWGQDPRVAWWFRRGAAKACKFWMQRYDAHLAAIDAAYVHWMKHKCPDCCHDQPELAAASRYGFMQRTDVGGLPSKCVGEVVTKMKEREQSGSRESEFFYKYAKPNGASEPRWDYPDVDLWLIEIWPLVEKYGWTYKEVSDLAFSKFGGDDDLVNVSVLNDSKALKKRCREELGLCLSPLGQQRRGRPKNHRDDTGDPMRFGEEIYAKVSKFAESPDAAIRRCAPQAYGSLAKLAVNMEPFTRLLDGKSKELTVFAMPDQLRFSPTKK
jgi:hypothetical protein